MANFFEQFDLGVSKRELASSTLEQLVAATNSADGYAREAALIALTSRRTSLAIPAIVARLNDWVPQVRVAAANALTAHLVVEYFSAWLNALDSLQKLAAQSRGAHQASIDEIERFLRSNDLAEWFLTNGASLPSNIEMLAFSVAVCGESRRREALLRYAAASRNSRVVRRLLSVAGNALVENSSLRAACLKSRSVELRQAAVRALGSSDAASDIATLRACFFDPSPAVRSTSWFFLKQKGVASSVLVDQALAALVPGSTKFFLTVADFSQRYGYQPALTTLNAAMTHRNSRVRSYALTQIASRQPERVDALARQALRDPCGRVQGAALQLAKSGAFTLDYEASTTMLEQQPSRQLYRTLIQIQASKDRWSELIFLLHTSALREQIEPKSKGLLERMWVRRSLSLASAPTTAQSVKLDALLKVVNDNELRETGLAVVLRAYGVTREMAE